MLTVMSFNIRHGRGMDDRVDLDRIAGVVDNSGADIVALQEVDAYRRRSGGVDQAAELGRLLGMHAVFCPSLEDKDGQYGNAILSRFALRGVQRFPLPGEPGREPRSLMLAEVENPAPGVPVLLAASTHLGLSDSERKAQMRAISGLMAGVRGPAVWAGDFNMLPEDPLFQLLPAEWKRLELEGKAPSAPDAHAGTFLGGKVIDYIFVHLPAEVVRVWTYPTEASDHYPILAKLRFGAATG